MLPFEQAATERNRLGTRPFNHFKAWFGLPWQRRLARAALQVDKIRYWEGEFTKLSDADLKVKGLQLRRAREGANR